MNLSDYYRIKLGAIMDVDEQRSWRSFHTVEEIEKMYKISNAKLITS